MARCKQQGTGGWGCRGTNQGAVPAAAPAGEGMVMRRYIHTIPIRDDDRRDNAGQRTELYQLLDRQNQILEELLKAVREWKGV